MAKYFKTVFTVELLTEDEPVSENVSLNDIAYEMTEGHASGVFHRTGVQELSAAEAAKALLEQGSDPEFFMLDKDGNQLPNH